MTRTRRSASTAFSSSDAQAVFDEASLFPDPAASRVDAGSHSTSDGVSHSGILGGVLRGAWSLDAWDARAVTRLAIVFSLLAVCSWLGIVLSHQSGGVATIWLTNGLLFGLVITQPRQRWLAYFAAGLVADTLADTVYGDPFHLAIGVSLANSFEVVSSCLFLTLWFGSPLNLSRRRPLVGFLVLSVGCAAAITSALGASWTLLFVDAGSWSGMFRTWYLGDMLGMALIAPLVFMLQRPGFFSVLQPEHLQTTLLMMLIPASVTVLVFTHEEDPLMFLIFPAVLLVVIRLGFPGTVLTIFVVALLSIGLTVKGHGPLMLITGEHALLHRIVIAQIFLAVSIFTMFPVAALLEERAALQLSLAASEARYRSLASVDELTGLSNRRAFNLRLEQEWHNAQSTGQSIALLLLDVDLFKRYNDMHGHLIGDECLRMIGSIMAETVRDGHSIAARFGGEEFAIILPATGRERARQIAEDIRHAILAMALPHAGTPSGVQTASLGVAAIIPRHGQNSMELIGLADHALYRAKDQGRNRVVLA